jgi:predicted permease
MFSGNPGVPLVSYPDLQDIQSRQANVEVFAYRMGMSGLSEGDRADRILTNYVTGNYFSTLGVGPALGRLFLPSEGRLPGADPVIVLGYSYWRDRFLSDPSVIGKSVRINGTPVTIVGVVQSGFRGVLGYMNVQAYLPLNMAERDVAWVNRDLRNLFVLGRLQEGTSLARASASMRVIADRLSREYPNTDQGATIWLLPQKEAMLNPFPRPGQYQQQMVIVGLFLALVMLVLLLTCFNLANVMLVRMTTREHEMGVRAALGAPGIRLLRLVLTESFVLAFLGCVAGVLVGIVGSRLMQAIQVKAAMPVSFDFSFDGRVFAYAMGAAILSGFVVGIVPAVRAAHTNPNNALRAGERTASGGHRRLRSSLVVAQTSISVVLLIVAGLFTRSLKAGQRIDLGFEPSHVLMLTVDLNEAGYDQPQGQELFQDLLQRVRALPGVESAGMAYTYPSNRMLLDFRQVYIEDRPLPSGQLPPILSLNSVSPGYFNTLGIPILRGRPFLDSDTAMAPRVAVINQTMADQFWPQQDALGRRFSISSTVGPWIQVIGIARDSKYSSLMAKAVPYFYLPLMQNYLSEQTLLVRAGGIPEAAIHSVQRQVHTLAPHVPVFGVQTMSQALSGSFYLLFRFAADLTIAVGLLGLTLALLGVYGVMSYSMSLRTHEIGIRITLGASSRDILVMGLRHGLKLTLVGVSLGILFLLAFSRMLTHFLYGVSPYDPPVYFAVVGLIFLLALLTCYIPVRHALRINPSEALHYE